jgi:hypothetical protein
MDRGSRWFTVGVKKRQAAEPVVAGYGHRLAPRRFDRGRRVSCRRANTANPKAGPQQNGLVESFHTRLRDECLNVSWFANLWEARRKIAAWQEEYNEAAAQQLGLSDAAAYARQLAASAGSVPVPGLRRLTLLHKIGTHIMRISYDRPCGFGEQTKPYPSVC